MGFGAGGAARQPLGLAVVGGLLLSQVLTLYITPVVYIYFERLQLWIDSRRGQTQAHSGVVPDEDATLMIPPGGAPFPAGPHEPHR
jgi:HAE1 family hydrophobic/amphiphilic exporter-1